MSNPSASGDATKARMNMIGGVVGGVLIGCMIGGAVGFAIGDKDPTESAAYRAQLIKAANAETASELAQAAAGDLPEREQAVNVREVDLDEREDSVEKQEADLRRREKAVGIIERDIARNTIPGEGIFYVGAEMKPGTYRMAGSPGCYYAILNSPDTSDIVDNNNIDGPAIVRVRTGQYFETGRCGEWVLQR